jgi:hypothetical protein
VSALGITLHEADVVFTDLGLAILGAWFAWRLATPGRRGSLGLAPAVLMAGLASAAFWGAVFHGFFPRETETWPGFIAWIPVSLSIVVAAAALLELGLRVFARLGKRTRRRLVATYAAAFAAVVLLVDESFGSIVRFYAPALLVFLVGAALLQQLEVALHPVYFDHNAVYHVVQAYALVLLYVGFRRVAESAAEGYGDGTAPAPRVG